MSKENMVFGRERKTKQRWGRRRRRRFLRETDGRRSKVATVVHAAVRLVGEPRPRVKFSVAWMALKFEQRVRVTWSTNGAERSHDERSDGGDS